jgi:hypothetical protein
MNLPLSLKAPDALVGTAGTYLLYAEGDGNKLFVNTDMAPVIGRKDGTSYHAYGLIFRMLFAGDDPKTIPGLELRDKKAYKRLGTEDDAYAQQLNKMLFPIATMNIGSEALVEAVQFHLEAISELIQPLLEANSLKRTSSLEQIFEAQNPQLFVPAVKFSPPKDLMTWEESVADIKAAAAAKYEPKNKDFNGGEPAA